MDPYAEARRAWLALAALPRHLTRDTLARALDAALLAHSGTVGLPCHDDVTRGLVALTAAARKEAGR